jgi:hypothetical protein
VERDVLGTARSLSRDAISINVIFPDAKAEYPLGTEAAATRRDVWGPFAENEVEPGMAHMTVSRIRIDVEFESELSIADWDAASDDNRSDVLDQALSEFRAAEKAARSTAGELLGWTRVRRGQSWLGPSGFMPEKTGLNSLIDVKAGRRFPIGYTDTELTGAGPEVLLSLGDVDDLLGRIERREEPPEAEVFLRDAQYFAWHAETKHVTRAVLLAAIACELKSKTTMRDKVAFERLPLVESVIRTFRPTADLLDQPMLGALGVSLATHDPDLYGAIRELFTMRNRIAHHGQDPQEAKANEAIRAASRLFEWLDGIPVDRATRGQPEPPKRGETSNDPESQES